MSRGFTVWFTGMSGAGKSTLSASLAEALRRLGHRVEVLDGDQVRTHLSKGLGFSRADRDLNVSRIGFVANLLSRNGVAAIAAAISPYRDARAEVRRNVERDGAGFVEVYVKCPVEVLAERDVKGLYKRALAGEIAHFTGVSDPYEEPLAPDVLVESNRDTVDESLVRILGRLRELGHVAPEPTA